MKSRIARFLILGGILNSWLVAGEGAPAWAADMLLQPSLAVNEEFTDNIFESSTNKQSDFITRIQPGGTFHYQSPLWKWDTDYTFEYRNYARNSRSDEYIHNAGLRGNISIIDNFLFLDVGDTYLRVPLDIVRDPATVSSLFLNQTDQNIATISPYMLWRLGNKNTLKTGYRYTDTRYWGDGIDRREHGGFADLSHEVTSKFSLSAGYAFSRLESQPSQYNKHDLSGGFKYEYADRSFLFGQIGNSWLNFNNGNNTSFIFWNAGVTHDFNIVAATFETRSQISVDPNAVSTKETSYSGRLIPVDPLSVSTKETSYSGRLEKTLQRGMIALSASYAEFENTGTSDVNRRHRLSISGTGRYEVLQDLTANLSAIFERYSRLSVSDTPYRFTGSLGLSYAFKKDLFLGVTYTYATYRRDLDTTAGSIDINKAVVEVKKVF
jgi:hypothetical protein